MIENFQNTKFFKNTKSAMTVHREKHEGNQKFNPEISIRTSLADYRKEDWLINLPLYACTAFIDENGL